MPTTLLALSLLAGFVVLQRVLRRGEQARSLVPTASDRGSTRLIGGAFLFSAVALAAAPCLNAFGIGSMGSEGAQGWIGIAVMVCGLALRVWSQAALGAHYTTTLRHTEDQSVMESGPYRFVRHPGYAGFLMAWAGAGMATTNWAVATAVPLVMAAAYGYRIAAEEAMLLVALGDRYRAYMTRTWRLVPLIY